MSRESKGASTNAPIVGELTEDGMVKWTIQNPSLPSLDSTTGIASSQDYSLRQLAGQDFASCVIASKPSPKMPSAESIESPKHYTNGSIETWDYIVSQKLGYLEGNVIKYVTRYKHKNGLEDLLKAQAYLTKLIKEYR